MFWVMVRVGKVWFVWCGSEVGFGEVRCVDVVWWGVMKCGEVW